MASQVKLTVTRGRPRMENITVAAGTPVGTSDAMELNIDVNRLSRAEALHLLNELRQKIVQSPKWPIA